MKIWLGFVFCALLCCRLNDTPTKIEEVIKGKVVGITDGDTFTLLREEKKQEKIRLYGIDCPEKNQDFGSTSKKRLNELIFGKQVQVQFRSFDRWGRVVGMVFCNGENINERLITEGLAWHFIRYDDNPDWSQLEKNARDMKMGLWSLANPVPPWKWRQVR